MGAIGRLLQTGAVVTLHTGQPLSAGDAIATTPTLIGSSLIETGNEATNGRRVEMEATRSGIVRYAALWIDGQLESTGMLDRSESVEAGQVVYFPAGALRLRRMPWRS